MRRILICYSYFISFISFLLKFYTNFIEWNYFIRSLSSNGFSAEVSTVLDTSWFQRQSVFLFMHVCVTYYNTDNCEEISFKLIDIILHCWKQYVFNIRVYCTFCKIYTLINSVYLTDTCQIWWCILEDIIKLNFPL